MRIKKEVVKKIAANKGIIGRICAETGKAYPTILRWVDENDEGLTLASALKVIREELGLTDEQILEESTKSAA